MKKRIVNMRKSTMIKYFLYMFIIGILIRSLFSLPFNKLLTIALVLAMLSFIIILTKFRKKQLIVSIFLLGGIFLFLGFWRLEAFLPPLDESHVANYTGQMAEFSGRIAAEPDKRLQSIHYNIDVDNLNGNVLVFAPVYPEYKYGEALQVKCRLQAPEFIDDFDYPGYLAKEGVYAVCYNPLEIKSVVSPSFSLAGWLIERKAKLQSIISQNIDYPEATFLNSILLGLRRELPVTIAENFSRTGTAHLLAISGLHIVILSSIIFSLFRALRLSKKKAFVFVIAFLILFIALIGFKASAVRAGIFGLIAILSEVVARPKRATLVLLWAAVIILLFNPLLLVYDVGFQLSFLAVLGLIHLGPVFKKVLTRLPNWLGLRDILVMTLSAQLFVLPWLLYKFGTLSLIAPLANLLILPIMPLVMILGIILLSIGLVVPAVTVFFGWLAHWLIQYIFLISSWLAGLPGAGIELKIPIVPVLIIYLIMAGLIYQPTRGWLLNILRRFRPRRQIYLNDETEIVTEIIDLNKI